MRIICYFLLILMLIPELLIAQAPQVTSITPVSGPIGTLVTIKGSNIDNTTTLTFGGTNGTIISNDDNTLVSMVMPGTTTGAISLTTSTGNVTLADYTVTAPVLPITQQGNKLVPFDAINNSSVGFMTAISADGNTAIIGGPGGNGAAWIYIRSNGSWSYQSKLYQAVTTLNSSFGITVDISADGNTVIIGANHDDNNIGAAYVYSRSGVNWSLDSKLVGTGYIESPNQGNTVSLSANGKLAFVGGPGDGSFWVFSKKNNEWKQEGKVKSNDPNLGMGSVGASSADGRIVAFLNGHGVDIFTNSNGVWTHTFFIERSYSDVTVYSDLDLSADGTTLILSSETVGAVIYSFTNSSWNLQTSLFTTPTTGGGVSLSADGRIALVGHDDLVSVHTFNGTNWSLTNTLHGTQAIGNATQLWCKLSSDGQTAIVGGQTDNNGVGAFWVYNNINSPANNINTPVNPSTTQVTYNSFTANWEYTPANLNGNSQLLVSKTSDFSSSTKYEFASSLKSFTVKGLSPNTTYYWKVQYIDYSTNPESQSEFSSTSGTITTTNSSPDNMQLWGRSAGYEVAMFKINADGTDYKNIYSPGTASMDDHRGLGNVLQANDGYVYFAHATHEVGASNQATLKGGKGGIYKSTPDGTSTSLLYAMDPAIGYPNRMLMEASDGHFYGRFEKGESIDANTSGIYRLTKEGNFQVIYHFQNNQLPSSLENLVENTDGFLYGASTRVDFPQTGNRSSFIYKIAKDGSGYSVVYDFPVSSSDLALSTGTLVADKTGALYGKFYFADSGQEKIIKLLNGNLTSIKTFPTSSRSYDAQTLTIGSDGYLYGGILNDNWQDNGLFKISTDGSNYSPLYTFTFDDGFYPFTPLVEHNGKLYGTLWQGPTNFDSEIFSINLNGTGFTKLYDFLVTSSAVSPSPISLINPDAIGVVKQDQTITFAPLSTIPVGTAPVTLSATASSGLPVTYVSSNTAVATVNGNMLNVLSAGSTDITVSQVGDANYNAATDVKRTLVVNAAPCGVINTPTITANLADTEIPVLTSSADTGNQWFLNGVLINGAIQKAHIATQPGMYTVQVTQGNCISTLSDSYSIVITGIEREINIQLYPNPAENKLTFTSPTTDALSVQIIDLMGRTVKQLNYSNGGENRMDVSEIAAGSYIFKASQNGQVKTIHFYKK